jgi:hypothetical protein
LNDLLSLADRLGLSKRCQSLGQEFVAFLHDPSPTGEAVRLEDLRITKNDLTLIPTDLIEATLKHMHLTDPYHTEAEWLSRIAAEADGPVGGDSPPVLWFFVDSDWNVYPNLISMERWWRLGNIIKDSPHLIFHRYLHDESAGQRALYQESKRSIAARYGNPKSDKVFMDKTDLLELYLERHLLRTEEKPPNDT